MIGDDFQAEQRFRLKLHGFELPDENAVRDVVFEADALPESPLWQQHQRMLTRDATRRRN